MPKIFLTRKQLVLVNAIIEHVFEISIGDERPDHGVAQLKCYTDTERQDTKDLYIRLGRALRSSDEQTKANIK